MTDIRSRLRSVERRADDVARVSEHNTRLRLAIERARKRIAPAQVERFRTMTDEEWQECYFLAYYLNMGYKDIKVLTSGQRQILIDKFNEDVSKKRKGLE